MHSFNKYVIAVIILITFMLSSAYGRRIWGQPESSDESRERSIVEPTFIDTINRGKEISIDTDSNFSNLKIKQQADTDMVTEPVTPPSGKVTSGAFRIQCTASRNNANIEAVKRELEKKLDYPAYVVYDNPLYKLHVGDFSSREDAETALAKVKKGGYPEAWIVRQDNKPETR
jgi:septal ring-binding cell division protein DamX